MSYELIITMLKEFDYDKNTKEDTTEFIITMGAWLMKLEDKD